MRKNNFLFVLGCPSMFLTQTTYSTVGGSSPLSVAADDVNGDGKPDIVVANNGADNVGVLLNRGNGSFLAQITYTTGGGSSPYAVALEDVNGDGKPDIVVANDGNDNVGVLLNRGNGTFLPQTTYTTGSNSAPFSVSLGDVNGDGKPDMAVANSGTNTVGVLLNLGNGTFLPQITYAAGTNPRAVTLADVNGDNILDIVVANNNANTVGVFLNRGNGTFLAQTAYTTGGGSSTRAVTVGDVNGDNALDIVVANNAGNTVGVFLNRGNGTFLAQTAYTTGGGSNPRSVALTDVNGDNRLDIIVANDGTDNVGVLINRGNGTFLAQASLPALTNSGPRSIAVADVNGDNEADIVVANNGGDTAGVFLGC